MTNKQANNQRQIYAWNFSVNTIFWLDWNSAELYNRSGNRTNSNRVFFYGFMICKFRTDSSIIYDTIRWLNQRGDLIFWYIHRNKWCEGYVRTLLLLTSHSTIIASLLHQKPQKHWYIRGWDFTLIKSISITPNDASNVNIREPNR